MITQSLKSYAEAQAPGAEPYNPETINSMPIDASNKEKVVYDP